ncbi:MAG: DUF488 domain-containing protein [Cyanobacteria bacterium SZAS-4]|nr:DUF488 domain-containing protein [Cyanobacteria bacterium SZAS-4]
MKIYTIGFTRKSAEEFFERLKAESIEQLVDVRLNNTSQLSGFSKCADLQYFLKTICGATYKHELLLAPTQDLLDEYKKAHGGWDKYQHQFAALLRSRQVEKKIPKSLFQLRTVLLCSEAEARACHRKVVIDYLNSEWGNVEGHHL